MTLKTENCSLENIFFPQHNNPKQYKKMDLLYETLTVLSSLLFLA